MFIDKNTSRTELFAAVEMEPQLEDDLQSVAESNGLTSWKDNSTDELRDQIQAWIEQADECAA